MALLSENSIKSPFFYRRAKKASAVGRSPPQELEVSTRSGLYLLVSLKTASSGIVAHPSSQTGGELPHPNHQDPQEASGGQVGRMVVMVIVIVIVMVVGMMM